MSLTQHKAFLAALIVAPVRRTVSGQKSQSGHAPAGGTDPRGRRGLRFIAIAMGANRRVILGGSAGATLAILAGRLTYELDGGGEICGDSPCGMIAGITTTLLLEPFLLPAGVHLANRRWGSFGGAFFASLAAGAATLWMGPGVITTRWYC